MSRDIVVTWPKDRRFASYLAELERAKGRGLFVNFRVPRLPNWPDLLQGHGGSGFAYGTDPPRCYRVHDGKVRGWLTVVTAEARGARDVERVDSDPLKSRFSKYWPAGNYILCDPLWHTAAVPIDMKGFRGWRWFDRRDCGDG